MVKQAIFPNFVKGLTSQIGQKLAYFVSEFKAWFPYDRPDRTGRPDRSKQCTDDPSDYMETVTES